MDKIRKEFNAYFDEFEIELPKKLAEKGTIAENGWTITYVQNTDEDGKPCLDFVAEHRMTNMRLVRIHQNGKVELLDTIEESYSYDSAVKGDKERAEKAMHEHNERVTKLLQERNLL